MIAVVAQAWEAGQASKAWRASVVSRIMQFRCGQPLLKVVPLAAVALAGVEVMGASVDLELLVAQPAAQQPRVVVEWEERRLQSVQLAAR